MVRPLTLLTVALGIGLFHPLGAQEQDDTSSPEVVFELKFDVRNGTGDDPMIVVWLEDEERNFLKTLKLFSKDKDWYKELTTWSLRSRKQQVTEDIDAVVGATILWNRSRTISIPVRIDDHNLLDGGYIIRIESRRDKGGHYRRLKIPVEKGFSGGEYEHKGYIKKVTIKVIR